MNPGGHNGRDSDRSGNYAGRSFSDDSIPEWEQWLRKYRQQGLWDGFGPAPGHVGCRVPPELLHSYGYDIDLDIIVDTPRGETGGGDEHAPGESKGGENSEPPPPDSSWPDPCPLPTSLLPVDQFDLGLVPEKLRPW